ncbi:MAG: YcxB family protein [Oscillospiraceae bacterium]|nr:YcxB family protein [Oscillospiraceae bacterium]MDD4413234.1 YcxB family protein [Oscillospiraceae bacterium]
MEEKSVLSLSVLVTREEYSQAVAISKRKHRRKTARLTMGFGTVLILCGVAGLFFGSYIFLSPSPAACLVFAGLFLVCYDGLIAPILDRGAAAREFEEKEDLHFATTYIFYTDRVTVQNGRIQGELPLSILTEWVETPALFGLEVGKELSMAIPKRLLDTEQENQLRSILEAAAGSAKIA